MLASGTVAIIAKDNASAHKAVAEGREAVVYTLDEIGRLIELNIGVLKTKLVWPGAQVVEVRKPSDPLRAIPHAKSFDDPVDDLFAPGAG